MAASPHPEIFELAEQFVDAEAEREPLLAISLGRPVDGTSLGDFSAAGIAARQASTFQALLELDGAEPATEDERLAKAVMLERLASRQVLDQTGESLRSFSAITSPVAELRQAFELLPAETPDDVALAVDLLRAVGPALQSWRSGLRDSIVAGLPPARRQVLAVADQAGAHADGGYGAVARQIAASSFCDVDSSGLAAAAAEAEAACGDLATWLRDEVAPRSDARDAVGEDRYAVFFRAYTGLELQADDLFAWGLDQLVTVHEAMVALGENLAPDATTLHEVASALDADPTRQIEGAAEIQRWLEAVVATSVLEVAPAIEIDPRLRRCAVRLAPDGSASAPYYIGPSEDLSRPGTTWLPTLGSTTFHPWRLKTTWYHEAIPGHHLQDGTVVLERERLSSFQRNLAWNSGHGEGWALYAEYLMDELGCFADPAERFGYLSAQALRAARVVVDLGMHLELEVPEVLRSVPGLEGSVGTPFDATSAQILLEQWALEPPVSAASEIDRYLGWPGQAPTYKVGQRAWLEVRAETAARLGSAFTLPRFHDYALKLGPVGLPVLAEELRRFEG